MSIDLFPFLFSINPTKELRLINLYQNKTCTDIELVKYYIEGQVEVTRYDNPMEHYTHLMK